MKTVRVEIPGNLRVLAKLPAPEVSLRVAEPVTAHAVVDALEAAYPMLRGTVREFGSGQRRAYLRFFACEQDVSFEPMDAELPQAVRDGREPLLIVGAVSGGSQDMDISAIFAGVQTESGLAVLQLLEESPVLLVFLRHFGCAFCRQAISDVSEVRERLEKLSVRPVFVHMGPPEIARVTFAHYGMEDVERLCDPTARLYATFGLGKKSVYSQPFDLSVLKSWFLKGTLFRHGIGRIEGDGDQMPGVFFLRKGEVVRKFVHKSVADRPDYLRLVR